MSTYEITPLDQTFLLYLSLEGHAIIHTTTCGLDKLKSFTTVEVPREWVEKVIERWDEDDDRVWFCSSNACAARLVKPTPRFLQPLV